MKRMLALLLAAMMVLSLSACGSDDLVESTPAGEGTPPALS